MSQEAHREEMLVNRLMRQSQQERRIAVQLMQVTRTWEKYPHKLGMQFKGLPSLFHRAIKTWHSLNIRTKNNKTPQHFKQTAKGEILL